MISIVSMRRPEYDLRVDLGTSNVLIHSAEHGLLVEESAVIAIETHPSGDVTRGRVLATGRAAQRMIGKVTGNIQVLNPLEKGVVESPALVALMLKGFMAQAEKVRWRPKLFSRNCVLISAPFGATPLERHAFFEAAQTLGGTVALVAEPIAAAIGSGLPVLSTKGHMIVDIGSGITEAVVICMGEVVVGHSLRIGGNDFDEQIQKFIKRSHNFLISTDEAERIKMKELVFAPSNQCHSITVAGYCLKNGGPKRATFDTCELEFAVSYLVESIAQLIFRTLEITPAELSADILDHGILLTGGGSMLNRLAERLTKTLGVPVQLVSKPLHAVIDGNIAIASNRALHQVCYPRQ
jgi:rod shape-determining protein MreB